MLHFIINYIFEVIYIYFIFIVVIIYNDVIPQISSQLAT